MVLYPSFPGYKRPRAAYQNPYRFPYSPVGAPGRASFTFTAGSMDPGNFRGYGSAAPLLYLTLREWNGVSVVPHIFVFVDQFSDAPVVGAINVPSFQSAGVPLPALNFIANFAASIIANTGFIVEYTPGASSFTLRQPEFGDEGNTTITWERAQEPGSYDTPGTPQWLNIEAQPAPRLLTSGNPGQVTFSLITVGWDPALIDDLDLELQIYSTPLANTLFPAAVVHFTNDPIPPPSPGNAYVDLSDTPTQPVALARFQAALELLGFICTLDAGSIICQQPAYGPGGNTRIALGGEPAQFGQLLINGQPGVVLYEGYFAGGEGSNLFVNALNGATGDTVPLLIGPRFGMAPVEFIEEEASSS